MSMRLTAIDFLAFTELALSALRTERDHERIGVFLSLETSRRVGTPTLGVVLGERAGANAEYVRLVLADYLSCCCVTVPISTPHLLQAIAKTRPASVDVRGETVTSRLLESGARQAGLGHRADGRIQAILDPLRSTASTGLPHPASSFAPARRFGLWPYHAPPSLTVSPPPTEGPWEAWRSCGAGSLRLPASLCTRSTPEGRAAGRFGCRSPTVATSPLRATAYRTSSPLIVRSTSFVQAGPVDPCEVEFRRYGPPGPVSKVAGPGFVLSRLLR